MPLSQSVADVTEDGNSPTLLIIEEFSHRALNDYTCIIGMLKAAATELDGSSAQALVIDAAQSLYDRSQMFRALQAPRGQGPVDLAEYLETVCQGLTAACLVKAGIRLTLVRQSIELPTDQCWHLGLAVTELVMNAARHGLHWGPGDVRVEMSVGDIEVRCTVTDNGRPSAHPGIGRGRRIITGLVAGIGGRADWSFGPRGACAALQIPRPLSQVGEFAT